jgi:hypothetical protein
MGNPNVTNEEVGLLQRGYIDHYDSAAGLIYVKLNKGPLSSSNQAIRVPAPHSLFYNNGLFIGTLPAYNTPVTVGQGSGNQYYFVSFLAENPDFVPELKLGELLLHSNSNTKIFLDTSNNISIGSDDNNIHIDTAANFISTNFDNEYNFTEASRKVNGLVKRDLILKTVFDQDSKLESDIYDPNFYIIGMDPTATPNELVAGSSKNPPFVEQREMIYEFQHSSDIIDDLNESVQYKNTWLQNRDFTFPSRRNSRADTLSLTLASPNYLMEIVKGTVVDIFGNILDINRNPLPVGKDQNTLRADKNGDKSKAFISIREIERKSLAYHFEINARKDLTGSNGQIILPDINSNNDYARNRSRFFIDVDKEGQFKFNVPASSERGNVSLLTRYENYSTLGAEDNGNPDKLIFTKDKLDIFQDSFAAPIATPTNEGFEFSKDRGSILLVGDQGDGAPLDRITKSHIRHGTAYHDIFQTCYTHQNNQFISYQGGTVDPLTVDLKLIPALDSNANIVSHTIIVNGDKANAGGRSGSISFDGSLEMNIGANTVDRQSLWLDTAGGIIANIGRDLSMKSAAINMDGDVYMQIGGFGVSADSRFATQHNGSYGAVLDLRVMNAGGMVHMFRIDNNGVTLMTPGNLNIHSTGNVKMTADGNMDFDCETMTLQGRMVLKEFGGSI